MRTGLRTLRDAVITFAACGVFFFLATWVKNCGASLDVNAAYRAAARPQGQPSQWTGPDTFEAIRMLSRAKGEDPENMIDMSTDPSIGGK